MILSLHLRTTRSLGLAFGLLALLWITAHLDDLRAWGFKGSSAIKGSDGSSENEMPLTTIATESFATPSLSAPVKAEISEAVNSGNESRSSATPEATAMPGAKVIVMGKLKKEDTSWVGDNLPDWQNVIYTVDDQDAPVHTKINKGREAMPYLTYIIDHYHNLSSTIVFLHSHRNGYPGGWHTDADDYDNVNSVNSLNIDFIQHNGYANLRCIWIPGCADEMQPFREPRDPSRTAEHAIPGAWKHFFKMADVPRVLATPCCAQFAVSKTQVLKRPLGDYLLYRQWLEDTELDDDTSGKVFEYLWHVIFGQEPVYCPPLEQCYCDVYNRC